VDRELDRAEADKTLDSPDRIIADRPPANVSTLLQRRETSAGNGAMCRNWRNGYGANCGDALQNVPAEKVLGGPAVKITYDRETDSMTITLRDEKIKESDQVRPGIIADFGYDGGIVRFEILDASKVVSSTKEIQFAITD
jgi:uncharacterized protein YuzE